MTDLQKASIAKRFSAFLLDAIMVVTVAVGIAALLSWILGFNGHMETWEARMAHFETEYGVKFEMTEEEFSKLTDAEKENRQKGIEALWEDKEGYHAYAMMYALSLMIGTFSILFAIVLWDFVMPLIFKNGQTLGKKVFGLGVMRTDGVKISNFALFARAILGKYTVETMVPVLIVMMIFFGQVGIVGLGVLLLILILQIGLMIGTHTNSMIHDVFAVTVVVDLSSQKIFDSAEEMIEYKKRIHAEKAQKKDY